MPYLARLATAYVNSHDALRLVDLIAWWPPKVAAHSVGGMLRYLRRPRRVRRRLNQQAGEATGDDDCPAAYAITAH
jgi:hypothetical protein